ncbi:MAG: serine hydrolase domain-containing protein [Phenylobacterium sp.]|uniref:serine hydrolase domain-containing protein n=1 Tax=Phenylobacterium sp. TaxID=1871053 RepID=UPI002734C513|nr:serine hydrolase domain-containing protein [Phenylobacterium sp.]MDP3173547.1 serine hydrolase domain-containing protein [Phenylobacterium sp.]
MWIVLFACLALSSLTAWWIHASVPATSQRNIRPPAPAPLPTSPTHWRGKIDYVALDARIRAMTADRTIQGLAVAVVENGRLSFVQGYGLTSSVDGEPITAGTTFRWASLSKTVAGTLGARLAADGVLSLTEPVATFHTSLRLPANAERTLSVEQLLSQRSGLPKNAYDNRLESGEAPETLRRDLANVRPICAPSTCHSYQNVAFDAVSEVMAVAAHEPFEAQARERLFAPLGMTSATFGLASLTAAKHWAKPHRNGVAAPLLDTYYRLPAEAGVNTNILELAKWMQAQMGLAPAVLPAELVSTIQQARVRTDKPYGNTPFGRALEAPGYGLGMRSFVYKGHRLVGHSGAVTGYRATMMLDPITKTGIVMMWNSESNLPFRLQAEFFDLAYEAPFTDWLNLKAGATQTQSKPKGR